MPMTPLCGEMIAFYRTAPNAVPQWVPGLTIHGFSAGVFNDIQKQWVGHEDRILQWDWWHWHKGFGDSPHRFEIAIRLDGLLVGMVLGVFRPADGDAGARLEIWYLEGKPGEHNLKGSMLGIILELSYYYAQVKDATELRIVDPLPEVMPLYEAFGFQAVAQGGSVVYCFRTV